MPYANESPAVLRQKHRSRVPVVCKALGGGQTLRLLVPKGMDGDGFKDAVSKHSSFPAGLLCVGGRPLRKADDFGTLDKMYGNPQGCLEVVCHSRPADLEAADSSSVQAAAGSEARSGDSAPAAVASSETPDGAQPRPPSQRKRRAPTPEAAKKLLRKYPTRVPVICAQAADGAAAADLPRGARKMLAPREMLCGELRDVICRQLAAHRGSLVGLGRVDLFAKGTRLEPGGRVAEAFDRHRAEDGLLYVSLSPPAGPPQVEPAAERPRREEGPAADEAASREEEEEQEEERRRRRWQAAVVVEEARRDEGPADEEAPEAEQGKEAALREPGSQAQQLLTGDGDTAGERPGDGPTDDAHPGSEDAAEREWAATKLQAAARGRAARRNLGTVRAQRDKESSGATDYEACALKAYEQFHELPEGTATIDQVKKSSAGIDGWARQVINGAPQARRGPGEDPGGCRPAVSSRQRTRSLRGHQDHSPRPAPRRSTRSQVSDVSVACEGGGGEGERAEGRAQAAGQPDDGPSGAHSAEATDEGGAGRAERLAHQAEERARAAEQRARAAERLLGAAEEGLRRAAEKERLLGAAEERARLAERLLGTAEEGLRRAGAEAEAARGRAEAEGRRAEGAERERREKERLHALELEREAGKLHDAGERAQEAELARERASQRLSEAEEELLQLRRALGQREEAARQRQERLVALEQRERALEQREATLAQREGALEQRERALGQREALGGPPWPAPSADSWAHLFEALSAGPPTPLGEPPAGPQADEAETAAALAVAAAAAPPPGERPAPPPTASTWQTAGPAWAAQQERRVGDAFEQLRLDAVLAGSARQHGLEPELAHASRAAASPGGSRAQIHQEAGGRGPPAAAAGAAAGERPRPLAEGWAQFAGPEGKPPYYHSGELGVTTWGRPEAGPLPGGWSEHWDERRRMCYYHCAADGRVQWRRPAQPAAAPAAPAVLEAGAPEPDDLADWLQVEHSEDDLASLLADPPAPPGSCSATTSSDSSGGSSTCRMSEAAGSDRSDDWLVVEELEDVLGDRGELAASV